VGLCYYKLSPKYGLDQEYTLKSIEDFQEFTEDFPSSELVPEVMDKIQQARDKLAQKAYKAGELYYKMHDYDSAIIYLNSVLDNYYDTHWAAEALLKKGESYLKMKKNEEARNVLQKLLDKYPQSPAAGKASQLVKTLTQNERKTSE
jgi:outer membrane assembly lipoprotein YfiO